MRRQFKRRFEIVLLSIYLFNEERGYKELDRLLAAIKEKFPSEAEFIASVEKHRNDEYKHYLMFRHYFESHNELPLAIGENNGYIDLFVNRVFGISISELDPAALINDNEQFFRLCRLIMITEFRGMKQVASLLRSPLVKNTPELVKIFKVVERDEPTHCYPYQVWLRKQGSPEPGLRERLADLSIHYSLMLIKFPLLFLNPFKKRTALLPLPA